VPSLGDTADHGAETVGEDAISPEDTTGYLAPHSGSATVIANEATPTGDLEQGDVSQSAALTVAGSLPGKSAAISPGDSGVPAVGFHAIGSVAGSAGSGQPGDFRRERNFSGRPAVRNSRTGCCAASQAARRLLHAGPEVIGPLPGNSAVSRSRSERGDVRARGRGALPRRNRTLPRREYGPYGEAGADRAQESAAVERRRGAGRLFHGARRASAAQRDGHVSVGSALCASAAGFPRRSLSGGDCA